MRLEPWTHDEIRMRFREAGDTVRRLPRVKGPAGYGSGWPEMVRKYSEAYGYNEARLRPAPPSPRAIDRMEEVFTWFGYLDGSIQEMRALWLADACGFGWSQAGRVMRVSPTSVQRYVFAGSKRIAAALNSINRNRT